MTDPTDADTRATEDKPPTDPRPPCMICGSTQHTAGFHDNSEPTGYHDNSAAGDAEWMEH